MGCFSAVDPIKRPSEGASPELVARTAVCSQPRNQPGQKTSPGPYTARRQPRTPLPSLTSIHTGPNIRTTKLT